MTKYAKNWCYENMINIQCANCKYRIGYWCFEKEIRNGYVYKIKKVVEDEYVGGI